MNRSCTMGDVVAFVERRMQVHYRKVMPYMADIRTEVLNRAAQLADRDGVIPEECMGELFADLVASPEEELNLSAWLRLDSAPITVCTDGI